MCGVTRPRVDDEAAVEGQAALGKPFGVGEVADSGNDDIGLEALVAAVDPGDLGMAGQSHPVGSLNETHAAFARGLDDQIRQPRAEEPAQRWVAVDDGDSQSEFGAGRGDLHAEEPATDHQGGVRSAYPVSECVCVVEGADDVFA